MENFQTFSIMANWNLLPKSHREKDNLIIHSFKPFKDTISKTNTCFRQHHDNVVSKETFQRKRFRKKWLNAKSHHNTKENSWSYVNNPRIASTKTQSIFCNKTSFAKDKIQKRRTSHDIKLRYLSFLETKFCFRNS